MKEACLRILPNSHVMDDFCFSLPNLHSDTNTVQTRQTMRKLTHTSNMRVVRWNQLAFESSRKWEGRIWRSMSILLISTSRSDITFTARPPGDYRGARKNKIEIGSGSVVCHGIAMRTTKNVTLVHRLRKRAKQKRFLQLRMTEKIVNRTSDAKTNMHLSVDGVGKGVN